MRVRSKLVLKMINSSLTTHLTALNIYLKLDVWIKTIKLVTFTLANLKYIFTENVFKCRPTFLTAVACPAMFTHTGAVSVVTGTLVVTLADPVTVFPKESLRTV